MIVAKISVFAGTEIKIECDGGFVRVDSLEIVTCVTLRQYNPAQPAGCKGKSHTLS